MILNDDIKTNDVMVGKLVTGEEIVAKLVYKDQNCVKIMKPLQLSLAEHPVTKEPSLLPLPWAISIDENEVLKISHDKFIFISKPRKELQTAYLQIVSNLIIPSKNILK